MSESSSSQEHAGTHSTAEWVDEVADRFEVAWREGRRPKIEDFVADGPEPRRSALLGELVRLDVEFRRRNGEQPRMEEYHERFPSLTEKWLSRLFGGTREATPIGAEAAGAVDPGSSRQPASVTRPDGSSTSPALHAVRIRCPHCHCPIQLVDEHPDEILCPGCGSSFRIQESTSTTTSAAMRRLGKFQLLERVGVGAFGAVWKARDTELERIVALKIPHGGLLSSGTDLERFHREARAAAQLRHPGIVTVHEVVTLEGLPTIVSDYIDGMTLRQLLDRRKLTFRESASLIAQVADALDHAHGLGLVHRDLKPANIMIELAEGQSLHASFEAAADGGAASSGSGPHAARTAPRPLLLDFGLAVRDEAAVTVTVDGQILGTPAYMSPEQAAGRAHQVDCRSDVYSLGVMLYELLCGELPFRGAPFMIRQQVLHEDPRPPRRLNDRIPRDLETVCLKAMSKEPARRYTTASELADDLRRFLRDEPILARPVGQTERLWRWARRNPRVAMLSAAVLALLMMAATSASAAAFFFNELRRESDQRRFDAEQAAGDALRAMNELAVAYESAGLLNDAYTLLRQESQRLRVKLGADHPQVLLFMSNLGAIQTALGDQKTAMPLLEATLTQMRAKLEPDHPYTLAAMHNLATAYRASGNVEHATALAEDAFERTKTKLGEDDPLTLLCMSNLGAAYTSAGQWDKAVPLQRRAHERMLATLGAEDVRTLTAIGELGRLYTLMGQWEGALPLLKQTHEGRRLKLGASHPETITALNDLAAAHMAGGQFDEAIKLFEETLARRRVSQGDDHPETLRCLYNLGLACQRGNRLTRAESALRECLERRQRHHADEWITSDTEVALGAVLCDLKQFTDAEPLLLHGYEGLRARVEQMPPLKAGRLTRTIESIVQLYEAWEKPDLAAQWRARLAAEKSKAATVPRSRAEE